MDKPQTVDDDARFPHALKSMGTYFIINDAIGMRRDNWQIGANRVFPKFRIFMNTIVLVSLIGSNR